MSDSHGPPISVIARTKGQQIRRAIPHIANILGIGWFFLDTAAPQLHILFPDKKGIPIAIYILSQLVQFGQKVKDAYQSAATVNLTTATPQRDLRQRIPPSETRSEPIAPEEIEHVDEH